MSLESVTQTFYELSCPTRWAKFSIIWSKRKYRSVVSVSGLHSSDMRHEATMDYSQVVPQVVILKLCPKLCPTVKCSMLAGVYHYSLWQLSAFNNEVELNDSREMSKRLPRWAWKYNRNLEFFTTGKTIFRNIMSSLSPGVEKAAQSLLVLGKDFWRPLYQAFGSRSFSTRPSSDSGATPRSEPILEDAIVVCIDASVADGNFHTGMLARWN